jgi:hypothetical protein
MGRRLLAALVGGIVVFVWGYVFHAILPQVSILGIDRIAGGGIQTLPEVSEERISSLLRDELPGSGWYMFPWYAKGATKEQIEAAAERHRQGPTGVIIYHPNGREPMALTNLVIQFIGEVLCAFIAAIILSGMNVGYLQRVIAVVLIGLFAWISISVPQANWYRFPGDFTIAGGVDELVGWLLGGLAIAAITQPPAAQGSATVGL